MATLEQCKERNSNTTHIVSQGICCCGEEMCENVIAQFNTVCKEEYEKMNTHDNETTTNDNGQSSSDCPAWISDEWDCLVNEQGTLGIEMNPDCLTSWNCSLNVYELLGIRQSDQNPDPNLFVQDIVLAATSFIGVVVTISLVVAGVKYVFSAAPGNVTSSETAKKGILYAFLWLLLVSLSYAIIRVIQYIAAG